MYKKFAHKHSSLRGTKQSRRRVCALDCRVAPLLAMTREWRPLSTRMAGVPTQARRVAPPPAFHHRRESVRPRHRHCEERSNPAPCMRPGLLRRSAPRNDGGGAAAFRANGGGDTPTAAAGYGPGLLRRSAPRNDEVVAAVLCTPRRPHRLPPTSDAKASAPAIVIARNEAIQRRVHAWIASSLRSSQ
jgi:hypothetical protein